MELSASSGSELLFIKEFLLQLRQPHAAAPLTPADWTSLCASLELVSDRLRNEKVLSLESEERETCRVRLLELRQEIWRLERSLLKDREVLALERYQLQAAAAWNRSTQLA